MRKAARLAGAPDPRGLAVPLVHLLGPLATMMQCHAERHAVRVARGPQCDVTSRWGRVTIASDLQHVGLLRLWSSRRSSGVLRQDLDEPQAAVVHVGPKATSVHVAGSVLRWRRDYVARRLGEHYRRRLIIFGDGERDGPGVAYDRALVMAEIDGHQTYRNLRRVRLAALVDNDGAWLCIDLASMMRAVTPLLDARRESDGIRVHAPGQDDLHARGFAPSPWCWACGSRMRHDECVACQPDAVLLRSAL